MNMIVQRKVCFDHDSFQVKDGIGSIIQVGLQLNLYAAGQDPCHLPLGNDSEHRTHGGSFIVSAACSFDR